MNDRYTPTGTPLTPHQREILDIVQEEAAEVILAVSKIQRFGVNNINPSTGQPNTRELGLEIGDLEVALALANAQGLFHARDVGDGRARKHHRLRQFLQTTPDQPPTETSSQA